jgi:hypothetical protein
MTDFMILEDDESDYVYPSYKDKGDLIVGFIKPGPYSDGRKSVYE